MLYVICYMLYYLYIYIYIYKDNMFIKLSIFDNKLST